MQLCLSLDADARPTCSQLLRHQLFTGDDFAASITRQLRTTVCREYESNPLVEQTMRHRYERCRQQLQKTPAHHPTTDETQRHLSAASDTHQPNEVNNVLLHGFDLCEISRAGVGFCCRRYNAPNDDHGCTFAGNLQPGSRFFQSGLNPGIKSNPRSCSLRYFIRSLAELKRNKSIKDNLALSHGH